MTREEYISQAMKLALIEPLQKTPDGQKFNIGDIVRISNPMSWFSKNENSIDKNQTYEIQYSYYQKYNKFSKEIDKKIYSLKNMSNNHTSSWYNEEELELV